MYIGINNNIFYLKIILINLKQCEECCYAGSAMQNNIIQKTIKIY